jgi:hypothetical protein
MTAKATPGEYFTVTSELVDHYELTHLAGPFPREPSRME